MTPESEVENAGGSRVGRPPMDINRPPASVGGPPSYVNRPPASFGGPPATINHPPAYVDRTPSYVNRPPAYVDRPPAYVDRPPAYVNRPPADVGWPSADVTSIDLRPLDHRLDHRRSRVGRNWSASQVLGGILIAAVCAGAALWYVPRVMSTDRRTLTGNVAASGVLSLNFQSSGTISAIKVQPNEAVHRGQVLAVEYAPATAGVIAADKAAIAAVNAKIAELKSDEVTNPANALSDKTQIVAENADLALDESRLERDRARLAGTEIIAPSAGVIVATNGQLGESVTSSGIRNYGSSTQAQGSQGPAFSLLPEGPQSSSHVRASQSSLPVITLRISSTWSVVAYVSESSVSSIKPGTSVTVSVPAAGIQSVPGRIQEVLPNPVESSSGLIYEAIITISGNVSNPPLDGMAANVQLG